MTRERPLNPETAAPSGQGVRLPLARPIVTNVLLGLVVLVFLAETLMGGSTSTRTLIAFGGQVNLYVAIGQYWRLLASMFLHIGLTHLMFNGWALFSLGREVESLFGSVRFTFIYFLSGLFGSVAFYVLGAPNVTSAGASGAIFGLVGADIAYFLRNRRLFGRLSRQQLGNLLTLVVINLILGFTVPGINNMAHLGGLVSGFIIGLGFSPHYTVRWEGLLPEPRLVDGNSTGMQAFTVVLAVVLLLGGIRLGNQRWADLIRQLQPAPQALAIDVADVQIVPVAEEPAGPGW